MPDTPSVLFYAYPNTYSIGVHLLLEECQVPYTVINPKLNPAITDSAFYLASPHGRVPALVLPNGSAMCESGAIALYLADTFAGQRFTVAADSVERPGYLQWLFYLSSTLQPDVMMVFHPEHYTSDSKQQAELRDAATRRLLPVWDVLEKACSGQLWMFRQGLTAVDFALATVLLWPECFPPALNRYPALTAMLDALSARDSFKRIMPWHRGEVSEIPALQTPQEHPGDV